MLWLRNGISLLTYHTEYVFIFLYLINIYCIVVVVVVVYTNWFRHRNSGIVLGTDWFFLNSVSEFFGLCFFSCYFRNALCLLLIVVWYNRNYSPERNSGPNVSSPPHKTSKKNPFTFLQQCHILSVPPSPSFISRFLFSETIFESKTKTIIFCGRFGVFSLLNVLLLLAAIRSRQRQKLD